MTAPRPTGSIDIWNFVDNVTGTTVRKWLRDSWARRKIVALQQAVSSIVVPTRTSQLTNDSGYITQADVPPGSTASTTTPKMDGTAAVGTENAFARGDHRHPSDTNKADKATTLAGYGITNAYTKTEVDGMIPTVPTKTSDLTNDSDFQTGTQVGNAISAEAGLMVPYGYCTTAAATVAKTVTVSPAVTSLETGLTIAVKFQYANTGSNPTLNVNSLGAKAIKRYGTTAAGTSAAANWNANSVVMLTYDGTYWMLVDFNNTTYSGMTDAEYQAGTSTTNRLITPARLKAAIELHAPVQSVPSASSTAPAMDGTASAGSSSAWSRGDHVHPHDTTKQDTLSAAQLAAANSGITANDLAVNDASVLCTVTPIVPTLDAGSHYATYGGCWYYKIGSRVHVHIGVTGLTANTSTTLWQMPAGYIPYSGIAFDGQATTYNNVARFRVTGTGAVIVSSAAGNATGYCEYDAFS